MLLEGKVLLWKGRSVTEQDPDRALWSKRKALFERKCSIRKGAEVV